MEIDYNDLLKISNLSGISQDKMIKIIYEFLMGKVPDWDTRGNNPYLLHKRLKFPLEILREILFLNYLEIQYAYDDEDIYQTRPVKYSVDLLRKLDLSELDFTGWDISNLDLSYTNAKINPQTVRDKSLQGTNCKGLDLSYKSFFNVDVRGANLEDTNASLDPQEIYQKSLRGTNCKGLKFKTKTVYDFLGTIDIVNFNGVDIDGANLLETNVQLSTEKAIKEMNIRSLKKLGYSELEIKRYIRKRSRKL